MPEMLSLSNELLIHIFTACPTVQTAMQFSRANKQLQSIWLQHTDRIVKGIIKWTIPAADTAIDFALTETRLRNSLDDNKQPPLRLWLPNLMRNAELCASAHAACAAYVDPPNCLRKTPRTFPSSPAHWYLFRKVLLAFDYPQLRDAIHAELLATPREIRERIYWFHHFLVGYLNNDESIRQGVPMALRYPGPWDYPYENEMHQDAWNYMDDVMFCARRSH